MKFKERITINNFFSIEHFDWEIKDFNILTGEMASGKSICLKLLYFIEQIFHKAIFFSSISKEFLNQQEFYKKISDLFNDIFHTNNEKTIFQNTSIDYCFTCSGMIFDLCANWDKNTEELKWNSKYINDRLDVWRNFFINGNTPDAIKSVRLQIYESILHDFSNTFPFGAEFIPASRAIAAISNKSDIKDPFLEYFIKDDKPFVLNFSDELSNEYVNKILHLKKIFVTKDNNNEKTIGAISLDNREITPLELSSGQQELIYLLLLIGNLNRTSFNYGKTISVFIEEPSTHLFPQEQKESIEYIVTVFRALQTVSKVRFFISTHSPYVLNVVNNMLKKGYLIEKVKNCLNTNKKELLIKEIEELKFPHLNLDEISAYFVQKKVTSMINESENGAYLYEDVIENITQQIDNDYNKVKALLRLLKE